MLASPTGIAIGAGKSGHLPVVRVGTRDCRTARGVGRGPGVLSGGSRAWGLGCQSETGSADWGRGARGAGAGRGGAGTGARADTSQ